METFNYVLKGLKEICSNLSSSSSERRPISQVKTSQSNPNPTSSNQYNMPTPISITTNSLEEGQTAHLNYAQLPSSRMENQ